MGPAVPLQFGVSRHLLRSLLVLSLSAGIPALAQQTPLVIAHRGASGYLPEHTLEAKALAYGMGSDFVEQDVVLTKDDQPIVLHDIHLDTVTDVAERFPHRARQDGRFYAIDFSLSEIKQLRVHERVTYTDRTAVYPTRFPLYKSRFEIPTLAEEIELIQGLNHSTGRTVGIYPEIKHPAWHRQQGYDISKVVLSTLQRHGYRTRDDLFYLQCFDAAELKRLQHQRDARLPLIQLIGDSREFDRMRTAAGLAAIAAYADGIGPSLSQILVGRRKGTANYQYTPLVRRAQQLGLEVHAYTFRADALPEEVSSFEELLEVFQKASVDGIFTDFPDRCVRFFRQAN